MPDREESPSPIVMRQIHYMIFPLYHIAKNQAEAQSQGEERQNLETAAHLVE
jgi:hypothetical protein